MAPGIRPSGVVNRLPRPPSVLSSSTGIPSSGESNEPVALSQRALTTPESVYGITFYATPIAGQTSATMNRPGVAATLQIPMLFRGSVVGITIAGTAAKAGGSCIFGVRKNGSPIGANLTLDNVQYQAARFTKGTYGFVRDDRLDIVFTTDSGYTPITTIVEATIWVTQDSAEI